MSDEFRAILSASTAREIFITAMAHARAMVDNGEAVLVTVGPALEPITIRQRKFFKDVVCQQIAEQVRLPDGERYPKAAWAEYYRKEYLGSRYEMQKLPGQKRKTPVRIRISTESLGVKKYSEHIDKVIAHAQTDWSVEFHFDVDQREGVRYVARAKKPQPEAVAA